MAWNNTGNMTDEERPDQLNYAYFYCSLTVWFAMPLLGLPLAWALLDEKLNCSLLKLIPIKFLFFYAASAFIVYVYVPAAEIFFGLVNVFCHSSYKEDNDAEVHDGYPALKLPEQIGEAVPQLIIAATFYSKNPHWLDTFGILTMTLSAGSILMGIGNGLRIAKKMWNDDEYEE